MLVMMPVSVHAEHRIVFAHKPNRVSLIPVLGYSDPFLRSNILSLSLSLSLFPSGGGVMFTLTERWLRTIRGAKRVMIMSSSAAAARWIARRAGSGCRSWDWR